MEDQQPWTSGRCHRLLRQLRSRLTALRQLHFERQFRESGSPLKRAIPTLGQNGTSAQAQKRIKHTYGRRKQPKVATSEANENLELDHGPQEQGTEVRAFGSLYTGCPSPQSSQNGLFSSPLCRKFSERHFEISGYYRTSHSDFRPRPEITSRVWADLSASQQQLLQQLRVAVCRREMDTYEAILSCLRGILRASQVARQVTHSKSLMAMCLRKIPNCIAQIDAWDHRMATRDAVNSTWAGPNASISMYEQLEAFGSLKTGWRPLALVVQAHTIALLSEARSSGILDPTFIALLGQYHAQYGCYEDAALFRTPTHNDFVLVRKPREAVTQQLRQSLRRKLAPSDPAVSTDRLETIPRLLAWTQKGDAARDWTRCRDLPSLLAASLDLVAGEEAANAATSFLIEALTFLGTQYGRGSLGDEGLAEQLLLQAASIMATAIITLGSAPRQNFEPTGGTRTSRRFFYILDVSAANLKARTKAARSSASSRYFLVIAGYLARCFISSRDETSTGRSNSTMLRWKAELEQILVSSSTARTHYRQTVLLTSAVARYWSKVSGLPLQTALDRISVQVDCLELPHCYKQGLRKDAAIMAAHKTRNLRDIAFAEGIPGSENPTALGWRWEESIGEWVVPSPPTKLKQRRSSRIALDGGADKTTQHEKNTLVSRRRALINMLPVSDIHKRRESPSTDLRRIHATTLNGCNEQASGFLPVKLPKDSVSSPVSRFDTPSPVEDIDENGNGMVDDEPDELGAFIPESLAYTSSGLITKTTRRSCGLGQAKFYNNAVVSSARGYRQRQSYSQDDADELSMVA